MTFFRKKKPEKDDKGKNDEKPLTKKVPLRTLFRYTTPFEKVVLLFGLTISIVSGAGLPLMSILQGQVVQAFIDEQILITNPGINSTFTEQMFHDKVMQVVFNYAILAVAMFIAASMQVSCLLMVSERMMNRLRRNFVAAILRQEIAFFDKNSGGAMSTKIFDNLERVREGTGDKLSLMMQCLSQFFTGFAIAFAHDWKLALIMTALTPFQTACGYMIARIMGTFVRIEAIKYGKAGTIAEEVIGSIRTVAAFNGLPREISRYGDALREARKTGIKRCIYVGLSFAAMGVVHYSGFALAFYVGVGFVYNGSIEAGTMMTVFFSVMMGSLALGQAAPQLAVLGTAQGAAADVFEVLDREPLIDGTSAGGARYPSLTGRIVLEDVDFSYPSRPDVQVLKKMSLTVEPGETVALVGSSGSGKSTIVSLLLRYYDPDSGRVTIDGHHVSSLNLEFLRNQIGVVSQEPILFNCSIAENIRYGRENITKDEMVLACSISNAHKFISRLPNGYETLVGDRGTQLSGGQKQRIAIARALVRNPQILLLDEATSALDAESERVVQKALDRACEGRTTIIIAHRLSTIRNADKIIAMRHGEVIEVGRHDELIARRGLYYDLINAQTFEEENEPKSEGSEDENEDEFPVYTRQESGVVNRAYSRTISSLSTKSNYSVQSQVRLDEIDMEEMRSRTVTAGSVVPVQPALKKIDDMTRLKMELAAKGVKPANLLRILFYSRKDWPMLFLGLTFVTVISLVMPAYSLIFTQIINIFTEPRDQMLSDGHTWALMFVVLAAVQGICMVGHVYTFGSSAERLTMRLRCDVFRKVISHDMAYFDQPEHATGKICTRLAADVPAVKMAIDIKLGTIISTFLSIFVGICIAFYFGWQMALLTLAVFPITAIGLMLRTRVLTGRGRQTQKDYEDSGKIAMEAIEHIRTVQALTREKLFHAKFCAFLDDPYKDAIRQAIIQGLCYGFAMCSLFVMNSISYRCGLIFITDRILMPMTVIRVMYAISLTTATLGFATAYFPEYAKARLAGGIIFNMLEDKPAIDALSNEGKKPDILGQVRFRDVRFAYPQRKQVQVLRSFSLTIKPGQTIALVGPSGCGKSTTISLLERFYDVAGGAVEVDGTDIREINTSYLRSKIALVSQEPTLFDCTIAENIIYGMENEVVPHERIEEAARRANVHEFISSLPLGYETRVGERGTQLSGGQKQRIAIARALIRNPKILLLDEATSALDTESEKSVQEALDQARHGRTCLIIAHRLSSIINADAIAVVKRGVIIEYGTHQELIAKRGFYFELTQKQMQLTGDAEKE